MSSVEAPARTECKCSKGMAFRGNIFSGFDSSASGCLMTTERGEEVAVIKLWARTFQCEGSPTYTSSTEDAESQATHARVSVSHMT